MRSIDARNQVPTVTPALESEALDRIVAGIHDMIAGFRCAGTGRLVKAGVSMTHMHVMWLLQHHGDLSMSRLAELLDVSFSNATGIVDRMAERGLVERVRVPDDRRVVIVRASAEGARQRDEIEALKQGRMRAILERLNPEQLTRIHGAIGDLRNAVIEEIGTDHLHSHPHAV